MRPGPREDRRLLKIGELAAHLGTTVRTLHYYEEEGLLTPDRTPAGTRVYAPNHVARAAALIDLVRAGVGLDALRTLSSMREQYATGAEASSAVTSTLDQLDDELAEKIRSFSELREDIARARRLVDGCRTCPNRPNRSDCPTCPVDAGVDTTKLARLLWDPTAP